MGFSELATLAPKTSAAQVLAMSTGGFLPRFQVCGGQSDAVKSEKLPVNVFGIIYDKEKAENLGKEVNVVLLAYRVKALDMSQKGSGKIMSYYDPASDAFQNVQKRSFTSDSNCSFGPEFLVWVPAAKNGQGTFATLFLGSKTARREGPNLMGLMGDEENGYGIAPATLKIKIIKTEKYSWAAFETCECVQSIDDMVAPDKEEFAKQLKDFANPVSSTVELIAEGAGPTRER